MGLTAFVVFVVPWALLAAWLTRSPTALRLGTPAAAWRPIPTRRDLATAQRRDTNPHRSRSQDGAASTGGARHSATDLPAGGALHPSVEPTEPDA
jgi:hypothetical protein